MLRSSECGMMCLPKIQTTLFFQRFGIEQDIGKRCLCKIDNAHVFIQSNFHVCFNAHSYIEQEVNSCQTTISFQTAKKTYIKPPAEPQVKSLCYTGYLGRPRSQDVARAPGDSSTGSRSVLISAHFDAVLCSVHSRPSPLHLVTCVFEPSLFCSWRTLPSDGRWLFTKTCRTGLKTVRIPRRQQKECWTQQMCFSILNRLDFVLIKSRLP